VVPAYDGVCTPEFFGLNTALELRYRGRLDGSRTALVTNARRELFGAMCRIAEERRGALGAAGEHGLFDRVAYVRRSSGGW
jgi:hypothetical protein